MPKHDNQLYRDPSTGEMSSFMSSDDFEHIVETVFGHGGKQAFARITGLSYPQVIRYAKGKPIPKKIALIAVLLAGYKTYGIPLPDVFSET